MSSYLIYLFSALTIVAFCIAIQINKHWKSVVFNAFIITILILMGVLLFVDIPYETYMAGNAPLNNLLAPAIVALALPLYEQLRQIMCYWRSILLITFTASIMSMFSGAFAAILCGAEPEIVATVLPKSVTTPIAMAISDSLGGIPAITAVGVIVAGLQGSIFGYLLLKKCGVRHAEAIGLAIGSVSHALGTASCMEADAKAGLYSSISLVLCGIMSSIFAPIIFNLVYYLF